METSFCCNVLFSFPTFFLPVSMVILAFNPHFSSLLFILAYYHCLLSLCYISMLCSFVLESLCCVQLGSRFWSEECMGLTQHSLVFIKHSRCHSILPSLS